MKYPLHGINDDFEKVEDKKQEDDETIAFKIDFKSFH